MVDKNDALLREVEEEIRREKLAKIWDQYGTYLLGAAILFVAAVGGVKFWEARRHSTAETAGVTYVEALRLNAAGKADEGAKMLDTLVKDRPGGYGVLAELQQAGTLLRASRPLDALAIFEKISKDPSSDPLLRDFAKLQAATLRVGEADFTEMQNRLNDLVKPDGAFRHAARELLGLSALKAGRTDEARTALGALIGDREAPQSAQQRARMMLGSLATSELTKAGEAPAPAPAAAPAEDKKTAGDASTGGEQKK